jgi:hypothetical protein
MYRDKGIITIAIGKKYAVQAKYLAYSCLLHVPHILRAVITDIPDLLSPFYDIIVPFDRDGDDPFSVKTCLPHYTPFEKTLYLDSDSLVVNNIDYYWQFIESDHFSYFGIYTAEGNWYYDVPGIIKRFGFTWFPKFNSGMLLFDKSEKSKTVFDTAYHYFVNHKDEGIDVSYFRGAFYPDEPFFAISFAKNGIKPVEDHGRFSRTLINARKIKINVIRKIASFIKDQRNVYPLVVHFCGRRGGFYYLIEKIRFFFYFNTIL